MKKITKILIIRLSSIGDIVLTTPVIRCIKNTYPDAEIHYFTKASFANILDNNPYISKIHTFSGNLSENIKVLKNEHFDFVVDLHHNLRSLRTKMALHCPSASFPKLNIKKWWYVKTKNSSVMPDIHIVDRYFETVKKLNVINDGQGLDFFEAPEPNFQMPFDKYIAIVCGASFETKQIPLKTIFEITQNQDFNYVILGDNKDLQRIENEGINFGENTFNACGKTSLNESAILVKNATAVISSDTGLMHIAAAFGKKTLAIWGNTTPRLGMYPYMPKAEKNFINLERLNLNCRPCSKLGYHQCPKGDMRCMNFSCEEIFEALNRLLG